MPTQDKAGLVHVLDQIQPTAARFSTVLVNEVHTFGRSFAGADERWSLIDCGLRDEHWSKIAAWARTCKPSDVPKTETLAAGILLLLIGASVARSLDKDEPLWHMVAESCSNDLRKTWFTGNDYPVGELRRAVHAACDTLDIRNQLDLPGKHRYWRTILLQFGFSAKVGASRLPYWLAGYGIPDTIRTLLSDDDLNRSTEFRTLWSHLCIWNRDQSKAEIERELLANPWYPREAHGLIKRGLTATRESVLVAGHQDEEPLSSLLSTPRLRNGQFQFSLSTVLPQEIVSSPQPVLKVFMEGTGVSRLIRDDYGDRKLECGVLSAATSDVLRMPTRELIVVGRTGVIYKELVSFWPTDSDLAIFRGNTGHLVSNQDRFVATPRCQYTLVTGAAVDLKAAGSILQHAERSTDWKLFSFPDGLPHDLEARIDGLTFWTPGQHPALPSCAGFFLRIRETSPTELSISAHAPHGWKIQSFRFAGREFSGTCATIDISPASDYLKRKAQIIASQGGSSYGFEAELMRPGPVATGAAIEIESGKWVSLPSGVLEASVVEGRRLAFHWNESTEDPWLTLGATPLVREPQLVRRQRLRAIGEPLQLRFGLMNEDVAKRLSFSSAVWSTGILADVSDNGDLCLLKLREEIEAAPDLRVWVWENWSPEPRLLDRTEVESHSDNRTLSVLQMCVHTPLAWAVSLEGEWQGARFHVNPGSQYWPRVASQMVSTLGASISWQQTAGALRWWRFPVFMDAFRSIIAVRTEQDPVSTLIAWIDSGVGSERRFARLDSDYFASALRSFLWRYSPSSDDCMRIWQQFAQEVATGVDQNRVALPALLLQNAHPVVLAKMICEVLWTTQAKREQEVPLVLEGNLFRRIPDRKKIREIEQEYLAVARLIVGLVEGSVGVFSQDRQSFEALRDEALWELRGWRDRSPLDEAYFREQVVKPAEDLFDQKDCETTRLEIAVSRSRACCAYLTSHLLKTRGYRDNQ